MLANAAKGHNVPGSPPGRGAAALYRRQTLEECRVDGEVFDEDFFAY